MASLISVQAVEPLFTKMMIAVVGPLPPSSAGNKYLLTIMNVTTRYPHAILVSSIYGKAIVEHLMSFITYFVIPQEFQLDLGVNFT